MPGRQRQCEDLVHEPLGLDERRNGKVLDGGLTVGRHRIVNAGLNAARLEKCGQLVPSRCAHDIEVVNVTRAGPLLEPAERQIAQDRVVPRRLP